MKEKRNNYQILLSILIIVHSLYICLSVFKEKVLLTDDLARVYELRTVSGSYFSYIYSFLDSVTMAARPVSGLVTGTLFYLVRNNESLYFLGLLFFPLSLAVLYWVAKNIFSKEWSYYLWRDKSVKPLCSNFNKWKEQEKRTV